MMVPDPFAATAALAERFTDSEARRGVWRGAALIRRAAAASAESPAEYQHHMKLADAYEACAAQANLAVD